VTKASEAATVPPRRFFFFVAHPRAHTLAETIVIARDVVKEIGAAESAIPIPVSAILRYAEKVQTNRTGERARLSGRPRAQPGMRGLAQRNKAQQRAAGVARDAGATKTTTELARKLALSGVSRPSPRQVGNSSYSARRRLLYCASSRSTKDRS